MRGFAAALVVLPTLALSALVISAQTSAPLAGIQTALTGSWVGTLEYRDYSEPAGSTKRMKLPTWLHIEAAQANLRFLYVYDDGPAKTVSETEIVRIDPAAARYEVIDKDSKVKESYAIAGLAALRDGRGTLTLTGPGNESGAPVDVRTTIRIGRNIVEMTRETALSGQPFVFRHAYTMVRSTAPGS